MRKLFERYPNKSRRLLEISIPLFSLLLLSMPVWLSFINAEIVGYVLITFNVYWLFKSITLGLSAIRSYVTLMAHSQIAWGQQLKQHPHLENLYHAIIIPEFKEPIHILQRTIANIAQTTFPKERLIIVLAQENADPQRQEVQQLIEQQFKGVFFDVITTVHTLTVGEVAGKSANMAHAGKELVAYLEKKKIPIDHVLVTSCDADALLHPNYLAYVTLKYGEDPNRDATFFQGAILFYSNIWRIPLPNRFLNILNSIWNLASLSQPKRLINFSTYSINLKTVQEAGYWGVDVIPEDYHLFFRVYFTKGERLHTTPVFLPILVDAAESHTFIRTMVNQYEQAKRWAWGVSDMPYVIRGMVMQSHIALFDRLSRLFSVLEHHILWPVNWFLLTIGGAIPPLVNPNFARTVFGHNLSRLSSGILTLSTIVLLVVFYIDWKIKPPKPSTVPRWSIPLLYLQWFTMPVLTFFLNALPGLDAHTRLLLGKRLEYRVTEKV